MIILKQALFTSPHLAICGNSTLFLESLPLVELGITLSPHLNHVLASLLLILVGKLDIFCFTGAGIT